MLIAYELKQPLETVESWDLQTIKWWLAFFKRKQQLEEKSRNTKNTTPATKKRPTVKRRPQ